MSTFTHLAETLKREEGLTLLWECDAEGDGVPVVSLQFGEARLDTLVGFTLGADGHYPLTDALALTPDAARLLGLALIEASGLALGAWGAQQSDELPFPGDDKEWRQE